ncbi:hypothetical protein J2S00_003594 [Caldalkalibacillus uzonensis]|uniref:Acyl-CoA dehydrogenase/oxidase C-terminal domain-containing protein n=1 Tax=Caldalkalibacillus uzonensis TaxID=353224 RepID=A0ABU0CWQ1_9BACI|nr:hypothetical protein [Caldalkalibacillus uzonensis]
MGAITLMQEIRLATVSAGTNEIIKTIIAKEPGIGS